MTKIHALHASCLRRSEMLFSFLAVYLLLDEEPAGEIPSVSRQLSLPSQGAQEIQQILLLTGSEGAEISLHGCGFASIARVIANCGDQVGCAAIMQKKDPLP